MLVRGKFEALLFNSLVPAFTGTNLQIISTIKRTAIENIVDRASKTGCIAPIHSIVFTRRRRRYNRPFDCTRLAIQRRIDFDGATNACGKFAINSVTRDSEMSTPHEHSFIMETILTRQVDYECRS